MEIIELTVRSCLHLVRVNSETNMHEAMASGVIIKYQDRFFFCTVAHFSNRDKRSIGILTGRLINGDQREMYEVKDFSNIRCISFEDEPDAEDLEHIFNNPQNSGTELDIAFTEITLLTNILQERRVFNFDEIGEVIIEEGSKCMLVVDDNYDIDDSQLCSFYGRIRPRLNNGIIDFGEHLYYGLSIRSISENYFEMDLGEPLKDYSRFKGCSGAPIIDLRGRIIGLVTHGSSNLTESKIYGIRFDKVKQWIDLTYFQLPNLKS